MSKEVDKLTGSQTVKMGNKADGNYSETRADGTQRLKGDATAWKDMVCDLMGQSLLTTRDKIEYDWDDMVIVFNPGGNITKSKDRIGGNLEINHEFKVGTDIVFKPHIHWFQEVVSGVQAEFDMTIKYRLQRNATYTNQNWTTAYMLTGLSHDDIFDFSGEVDGYYNQITRFPDMTFTCGVSDTIQFQIARTDSNGGDMLIFFFDIHGMIDSFGSDEEIGKAP